MEIIHILNRGVGKQKVFLDKYDYLRFLQNLYMLNSEYRLTSTTRKKGGIRSRNTFNEFNQRQPLVNIHAFCLMPNHYHILLSPIDGDFKKVSLFMHKLSMAYAKYFNKKYNRSGHLWQGKYKMIQIVHDGHFMYIPYYIHLNPLDLKYPKWREGEIKDVSKAISYLEKYKWSSYLDYSGKKNFPSIINTDVLSEILGTHASQVSEIEKIITTEKMSDQDPVLNLE